MILNQQQKKTLVVNLFAGPGAGKSTLAAGLFYYLKKDGQEVELAHEYAKDLTWEKRHNTLENQPYVFGKQWNRIYRLLGQVDIVITDSPIFLGVIYGGDYWGESFTQNIVDIHNATNHVNFFISRTREYNPNGRNQTKEEALAIDELIRYELHQYDHFWDIEASDYGLNDVVGRIKRIWKVQAN